MRPSLPVEGISVILGNDLAGEKVMVDPRVVRNLETMRKQRSSFLECFEGKFEERKKERRRKPW